MKCTPLQWRDQPIFKSAIAACQNGSISLIRPSDRAKIVPRVFSVMETKLWTLSCQIQCGIEKMVFSGCKAAQLVTLSFRGQVVLCRINKNVYPVERGRSVTMHLVVYARIVVPDTTRQWKEQKCASRALQTSLQKQQELLM